MLAVSGVKQVAVHVGAFVIQHSKPIAIVVIALAALAISAVAYKKYITKPVVVPPKPLEWKDCTDWAKTREFLTKKANENYVFIAQKTSHVAKKASELYAAAVAASNRFVADVHGY